MKIAEIAPLWERLPPPLYGGTERIVSSLTENLVKMDHDVTLYATGDSQTTAKLKSVYPRPLFRDNISWNDLSYPLLNITEAFDHADDYDIIHMHLNKLSDYIALPLAQPLAHKVVFTLHFPYPLSQNRISRHTVFQKYKDLQYISISDAQRAGGDNLNWLGTVYNGIEVSQYTFHAQPQDYYVWIGKFNPDKGVREAILAAKQAGVKLVLAGKVDTLESEDRRYYVETIQPMIDGDQITYVGEADEKMKNSLFGNAKAFLNPINWNEPFGLVIVEAMATGTPVISFDNGAASELIEDTKTGFLVKDVNEMVQKINLIENIDRKRCRTRVEKYFSSESMTNSYEKIFKKIINQVVS